MDLSRDRSSNVSNSCVQIITKYCHSQSTSLIISSAFRLVASCSQSCCWCWRSHMPPEPRFLKRACMRQSADQGLVFVSRFRDANRAAACRTLHVHRLTAQQLFAFAVCHPAQQPLVSHTAAESGSIAEEWRTDHCDPIFAIILA